MRADAAQIGMSANLTASASAGTVAGDFGAAILPVQHFAPPEDRKLIEGERRLLLAVLEDAVRCYVSGTSARNQEQRKRVAEARNWFRPPDDFIQEGPFTFASVCEFLGIEPRQFLRRLEAISIRDLPSIHRQSARRLSPARPTSPLLPPRESRQQARASDSGIGTSKLRTWSGSGDIVEAIIDTARPSRRIS